MKSALDIMPRCDEARHVWNREIEMNDLSEANPGQRFAAAHVRNTILAPQNRLVDGGHADNDAGELLSLEPDAMSMPTRTQRPAGVARGSQCS